MNRSAFLRATLRRVEGCEAEAAHARALARGIQGLSVRVARRSNQTLGTKGKVFADRYYARVLKTPAETRRAVAYVINNLRHHESQYGRKLAWGFIDPLSSGLDFSTAGETRGHRPRSASTSPWGSRPGRGSCGRAGSCEGSSA